MRSQLLAGVALGALALSTATAQAGAGGRFGGYTAGIDLGYIDVQGAINDPATNFSNNAGYQDNTSGNGTLLGGRLGYDAQLDGGWLIGGELNVAMIAAEDSTCGDGSCAVSTNGNTPALAYNLESLASLRARLGYVADPAGLLYVFGGFARARAVTHTRDSEEEDGVTRSYDGYTIGGGGQYAIGPNADIRLEIAYYDFEKATHLDNDDQVVGYEPEAVVLSLGAVFHID